MLVHIWCVCTLVCTTMFDGFMPCTSDQYQTTLEETMSCFKQEDSKDKTTCRMDVQVYKGHTSFSLPRIAVVSATQGACTVLMWAPFDSVLICRWGPRCWVCVHFRLSAESHGFSFGGNGCTARSF